jgi:hypothetical protein
MSFVSPWASLISIDLKGAESMPAANLVWHATLSWSFPGQEVHGLQALGQMLGAWLEVAVLLSSFTLAIFVLLAFAVRVLLIVRKLPVPVDPIDMAKPKQFRALMLGAAALLAPLAASSFIPVRGTDPQPTLVVSYAFESLVAVVLWFALDLFYRVREWRSKPKG